MKGAKVELIWNEHKYLILFKRLGTDRLCCRMVTDAKDSLWLDEMRCDKKVYHVNISRHDDAIVIDDPEAVMGRYLAHVLTE